MLFTRKATFILADGHNDEFTYQQKDFRYKLLSGDNFKVDSTINTKIRETLNHNSLKRLVENTKLILDRSKISTVDVITLPSTDTAGVEDFTIVAGHNAFAMLNSYLLSADRNAFLNKYMIERNRFFASLRRGASNPLSIDQSDKYRDLYVEILKIFRNVMITRKVKNREDYYTMLKSLSRVMQKDVNCDELNNAENFVKEYSK